VSQGQRAESASSESGSGSLKSERGPAAPRTIVGASFTFDPAADGMAGIYAVRVLDRGGDPRALCAELRFDKLGGSERTEGRRTSTLPLRADSFGRGTAAHRPASPASNASPRKEGAERFGRALATGHVSPWRWLGHARRSRRLTAAPAGLSLLFTLGWLFSGK
jgi:hypothetical protein